MGQSSEPEIKQVDNRFDEQKVLSGSLADMIGQRMGMEAPELPDFTTMGADWTKGVMAPMMDAFRTYVEPEIAQGFRRGGLFSQSRGNAIQRALSDMMGQLTTEGANRNWQATLAGAEMAQRPYYQSPAFMQEALNFLNLPGKETVGFEGQAGPDWLGAAATIGGAAIGGPIGGAIGSGIASSMGGGGFTSNPSFTTNWQGN